jgi:hypothetical protein
VAAALLSKMGFKPGEKVKVKLEFMRMLVWMNLDPARMELLAGFFETYLAHTLVFALILLVVGLFFYGVGRRGLLYVALASAGHLVLDRIWQLPQVLFWPLYGYAFPAVGRSGILAQLAAWWYSLWTNPWVFVPEIIGAAVILAFSLSLRRHGGFSEFAKSGTVPWS